DAIKNFNIAREISYGDYYGNLSKAYHDLNSENYPSALGRTSSAIEENPTDPMPYLYKGIALYYLGEIDGATFHLETALELNPDNPTILYNLGLAYLASSDPNLAIPHLQSAMDLDPSLKPYIDLTDILEDK
ncbi:MAG: tetratricopeptide repeat protein, partial [Chloroflexota bacterium]|nr:tetratricopeptide repeat protein [Chloroflexota bacterium]